MREIKFRGWNKKDSTMIDWGTLRQTAFNRDGNTLMYDFFTGRFDYEIMQFTGLKDMNGKAVYEGDIIHVCNENTSIEYSKNDYAFIFWLQKDQTHYALPFLAGYANFSVIGNIYENPELIEA